MKATQGRRKRGKREGDFLGGLGHADEGMSFAYDKLKIMEQLWVPPW